MEITSLKEKLNKLGYKDYLFTKNEIAILNGTPSKLKDELIALFIVKKDDGYILTDRFELINNWLGHEEIKNKKVIEEVKQFANKFGVSFEKELFYKKLEPEGDLKKQIDNMFKVLIYADDLFSKTQNN